MAEQTTDWWANINKGASVLTEFYKTYKDQGRADDNAAALRPSPAQYPVPSAPGVFTFGQGAYGGFSGLQIGLLVAVVGGLFFVAKKFG